MSMEEYRRRFGQPVKAGTAVKPAKPSKYKNQKIEIDGHTFDSKKEGKHYQGLKLLERTGQIQDLQLQVVFVLVDSVVLDGRKKPAMRYIADFVYFKDGLKIVEDVKSKATRRLPAYRQKKHLMASVHGIEIREV
ncbi:MAG: DUF1064 domain-containing protein [Moraxellaceae bacterium]|nr:MAG: DUF1064 domain-containing protein [Moraxellaceae bacterium]